MHQLILLLLTSSALATLPGCQTYHENQCQGNTIISNASVAANRWFTPPSTTKGTSKSFQDYSHLVAYAHVQYSDTTLTAATVNIRATAASPTIKLSYTFGTSPPTDSATAMYSAENFTTTTPLTCQVHGMDVSTGNSYNIVLDPIDFRWNAAPVKRSSGSVGGSSSNATGDDPYRGGQKGAIVEMFGWPDQDIEKECYFLAKSGYMGVKIYPHQEQVMSGEPFQNLLNPWYFMYQPVSYRLQGRMGSRADLRQLITTCRSLGVRVYAGTLSNIFCLANGDSNLIFILYLFKLTHLNISYLFRRSH